MHKSWTEVLPTLPVMDRVRVKRAMLSIDRDACMFEPYTRKDYVHFRGACHACVK